MPLTSKMNRNENGWYVFCENVGFGQTQYLQTDGTWGHYPVDVKDRNKLTGYFPSKEEAERVLAATGLPTKELPSVMTTCRKCNHVHYRDEQHECPTPEYLALHARLIQAALDEQEQFGLTEADDHLLRR